MEVKEKINEKTQPKREKCKHYLHSYSDVDGIGIYCACGYFKFIRREDLEVK